MDWQDLAAGLITALCAVLFLKKLFFTGRRKGGSGSCSCPKGTSLSGKSPCTPSGKRPGFPEGVQALPDDSPCGDCPFHSQTGKKEAAHAGKKGKGRPQ